MEGLGVTLLLAAIVYGILVLFGVPSDVAWSYAGRSTLVGMMLVFDAILIWAARGCNKDDRLSVYLVLFFIGIPATIIFAFIE